MRRSSPHDTVGDPPDRANDMTDRTHSTERTAHSMTPQDLVIRMLPPFGGWLALAALALPGGSPLRGAAVAVFLAAGPGAAFVGICGPALRARPAAKPVEHRDPAFERRSDLLERLMLAVLVSVSTAMLVSTVLISARAFSGQRVLLILTLLTTLAAFCPRPRAAPASMPGTTQKTRKGSAL
ncbi:hypothetical protein SUDANB6_02520 [Streptomyces sp. enrichment culture]|uniref:hypothetical protein n=1 Tax=Streptomyces sp. enrichment culture TaxID=1795815 RepID=UPI003F573137